MKTINQNELLSLNDKEKAKILKEICLGKIKYIGKDKKMNRAERRKTLKNINTPKKFTDTLSEALDFQRRDMEKQFD